MIFKTTNAPEFYIDEGCFIREIMNIAAIPNVSISQARVEVGKTTQLHSLTGDEMYYILKGKGEVKINKDKNQMVEPGDVAYIKAGQPQKIKNTGVEDLVFLCICTPRFEPENYEALE